MCGVVCATHRDLQKMIADGQFRQDLYFRIAEMTLNLPSLRERGDDVLLIARAVLTSCASQHGRAIKGFTEEALAALRAYAWPGNIRELQNRINSAVIMCDGAMVTAEELDLPVPAAEDVPEEDVLNLRVARSRAERLCVQRAMARTEGNVTPRGGAAGHYSSHALRHAGKAGPELHHGGLNMHRKPTVSGTDKRTHGASSAVMISRQRPSVVVRAGMSAALLACLLVACSPSPDDTMAAARTALEAQRPAEAIALLKPYIAKQVDDGMARALLAEALLDTGSLEEGRREAAEADRLRAPRSALRVSECRMAAQTLTLNEAMARCAAAQGETAGERAALHLQAGLTQLGAQHPVAAIAELNAALRQRPDWIRALQALAVAQTQAYDDTAAAATLAKVFKLAPKATESWHLQGELAFLRKEYVEAAAAFAKAAEVAGDNGQALASARQHGVQALLLAQQPKPALTMATALVQAPGAKPLDRFLYGQALAADGQLLEARNALEDLLLKNPDLAQPKIVVGIVLLGLGQAGQAEMYLRNALLDLPENTLAQAAMAALEQYRTAPEQAFRQLQPQFMGASQDPQWLAWGALLELRQPPEVAAQGIHLLRQQVAVLLNAGNRPAAMSLLKRELAKRESAEVLAEYAMLIAATDFGGAKKAMARAVELERDNANVLNTYGELYLRAGKPLEALPHLERAARLAPRDSRVQYHLALAYAATSNRSAARDAITEALRGGHMFDERRAAETLAEEVGAR